MTYIDIDVESDKAENILADLPGDTEDAADSAAEDLARRAKRKAEKELYRNGSVATGEGIRSLKVMHTGQNEYSVMGKKYLKYVDRGTKPHRPPINDRMVVWAEMHGMNPINLADAIEERGTMPHPWIMSAFGNLMKTADKHGAAVMKQQTRL